MKIVVLLFLIAGLGHCASSRADDCKVTVITQENNGKIEQGSNTVCTEGKPNHNKIRKGDIILENEVSKVPDMPYFKHNNSKCRMFEDRYISGDTVMVDHGVICQADNNGTNWLVLDRW
jgi:hypothetical protein